jgi:histone H1/5
MCSLPQVHLWIQCAQKFTNLLTVFILIDNFLNQSKSTMADVASPEQVAVATAASSPPKKAKKAVAKPAGEKKPKTSEMVISALGNLKERNGSSLQAIKKYIAANYAVDAEKLAPFIRKALKASVVSGKLVQTKGKGASGSFKLNAAVKKEKPKKVKAAVIAKKPKTAANKKPKTAAAAAAAAKKPKVAKKPAAKKVAASPKKLVEKKKTVTAAKAVKKAGAVKSKAAPKQKTTKTSKKPTAATKPKAPKPKKAGSPKKAAPKKK